MELANKYNLVLYKDDVNDMLFNIKGNVKSMLSAID